MRHTPAYALCLLLAAAPNVFSFEDSNNHYLRGFGHKHRRGIDIEAAVSSKPGSGDHPTWKITDSFAGKEFYDGFTFEAIPDPTHGRVNYVNMTTAIAKKLTEAKKNSFIMRADSKTILDPNGPGRDSVRIQSKKQWTTGVSVLDLKHMPEGCGTWPAYWMTQVKDWPINGEIDILEGVHDQPPNHSALHTVNGCTMESNRTMTGSVVATNCSWLNNWNQGCPVEWNRQDSFVTERTQSKISIWFWGRQDKNVPFSVRHGLDHICTKEFGTPVAVWESSNTCEFDTIFGPENIIINLTFCGDWAGQTPIFNNAGCPGECIDYVNKNPESFKKAYWDITSLKVYSKAV